MQPDEACAWLRRCLKAEVAKRLQAETDEKVTVTDAVLVRRVVCGGAYELSARRARATRGRPTCATSRRADVQPDAASRRWVQRIPAERLDTLAAAVSAMR